MSLDMFAWAVKFIDGHEEPEDECTCPACQFARAMAPHSPIQ